MGFPDTFVWGAAAASYQIEGAAYQDGKGLSVWDVFSHTPDAIKNGDTGDVACDHYNRYADDVALMREIGLRAYRLSISWPRIYPQGTGQVNPAGLDFYDRLIDAVLAAGITPYVTLFHWDFPYELYCQGGWLNRASADWFAAYATTVTELLSDRVQYWMPINEPSVFAVAGHKLGHHAPGDKLGMRQMMRLIHNILRAQGKATQAIRAAAQLPPQIGVAQAMNGFVPASDDPADVAAAYKAAFEIHTPELWSQSWWLDPAFRGTYPADGLEVFAPYLLDGVTSDDLIAEPMDFLGINNYTSFVIRAGADGQLEMVPAPVGQPRTMKPWNIVPEGLYWASRMSWERYNVPVYITENGMSGHDWVALDGKVHDPQRIDYTRRYLLNLQRACDDGVDVRGYFHWSVMDNFEWAEGMLQRFGLIHVDYATLDRTLKDSASWYREVIQSNGANLA